MALVLQQAEITLKAGGGFWGLKKKRPKNQSH